MQFTNILNLWLPQNVFPSYTWCTAFNCCRLRVNFGFPIRGGLLEPPTFSLVQLMIRAWDECILMIMQIILKHAWIIQDCQVFPGGWLHMRKQWVPGLFCLFGEQPRQTLLSATCKQPFQCTTVWCVLTFDVNKCAFVVSLVSLCLCVGDSNWPYLVNVWFLLVAGLVSLVEDLK